MGRKMISIILLLVMVLSLAACGSDSGDEVDGTNENSNVDENNGEDENSADTEANSGESVELRFSWWGGDSRHEATLKAIEAFETKYPNITVKAEYGAWDGWQENVATQMAGQTEPDLMQINWDWIFQFSPNGDKFYDLNQLDSIVNTSNYPQDLLDLMTINGALQGVPIGTTGRTFYWNETAFKNADLEIPTSYEEIIAAGEVFKEKLGDDYYPLVLGEYDRMLMLVFYLEQTHGKPWVADGEVSFSVEEVTEGLDFISMLEEKHVIPTLETLAGDGATSLDKNTKWMDGHYGGIYEWDSAAAKFQNALSEGQNFVMGPFPTDLGDSKSGFTKISMGYGISANTEHPEEAAKLLEFLTSDPEGVKTIALERGIVANKEAEKILVDEGLLSGITYDANKAVMEFKGFDIDHNFENSALKDSTGVYYEVFQDLSYGQTDSASAAEYLINSVNDIK